MVTWEPVGVKVQWDARWWLQSELEGLGPGLPGEGLGPGLPGEKPAELRQRVAWDMNEQLEWQIGWHVHEHLAGVLW